MDQIPSPDEIRRGDTTDVYFVRTMEVLRALRKERVRVRAEGFVKTFPGSWEYGILAGMDEMVALLAGRSVDVRSMAEGSLFHTWEPVFAIDGPYGEFGELETALLGILCQASGVATRAARIKHAAGDRTVLSFGARRMHPVLSTVIDRNAFIGGADGVSVVRSAAFLGEKPMGTMPHALILIAGDTVTAMRAFDEVVDPAVPRICLIDTLQDEKFEALRVAEALGERLAGVRLDTPSSRRGNFRRLIEEVRWELDLRGFTHVKIMVSGGLGEEEVLALRDVVDGFGIGTSLSNAPTIDFALDIVAVEGVPFAKRGKPSGEKQVLACPSCGARKVVPETGRDAVAVHPFPAAVPAGTGAACACGGVMEPLLLPVLRAGRAVAPPRPPREIRDTVLEQVARYHCRRKG